MNKCKVCGARCEKDYCFQHKKRIPLNVNARLANRTKSSSRYSLINTSNNGIDQFDKAVRLEQRRLFFSSIWNKRPHRSEISKEYLGKEASSAFFHHILPKSKYPLAEYDEENIILLTMDEHNNVENDMYKYEEINRRREILQRKYTIT